MKIEKEHYQHMRLKIQDTIEKAGLVKIAEHKELLKTAYGVKDPAVRFRWDLYHASALTSFTCDILYSYLDDTHIDTALKNIIKELGV